VQEHCSGILKRSARFLTAASGEAIKTLLALLIPASGSRLGDTSRGSSNSKIGRQECNRASPGGQYGIEGATRHPPSQPGASNRRMSWGKLCDESKSPARP